MFFFLAKTAAGLGGFSAIVLACFYYLKVFMDDVPNSVYWILSLLSPPAFAIAMEEVRTGVPQRARKFKKIQAKKLMKSIKSKKKFLI